MPPIPSTGKQPYTTSRQFCLPLYQIVVNTYRAPIRCIICGDGEITSSKGTIQGAPLAMAMYALAVKPLIGKWKSDVPNVKQGCYADDATGAVLVMTLRNSGTVCKNMVLDMDAIPMLPKLTL